MSLITSAVKPPALLKEAQEHLQVIINGSLAGASNQISAKFFSGD